MNLILQDAAATSLALGALVLLVRRIAAVVRPSDGRPPACAACPSACGPATPARTEPDAVVPVALLRGGRPVAPAPHRSLDPIDLS